MSFAEKANLAKQYLSIFQIHHVLLLTAGISMIIVGVILLSIIVYLIRRSNYETLVLDIPTFLLLIIGIILTVGSNSDTPQYYGSHYTEANPAEIDTTIVRKNHQLPIYKHRAKVDYQESLKLRGAKKYCVDHAYCKAHHKAINDRAYLKTHSPKMPWIKIDVPTVKIVKK